MVTGGILIGFQLLQRINDSITLWGTVLIFASLPSLGLAIWWRNIPASIKPPESASPAEALRYLYADLAPIGLIITLPVVFHAIYYYSSVEFIQKWGNIGPITQVNFIDAGALSLVVFGTLAIVSIAYGFKSEGLPPDDIQQGVINTLVASIGFPLVYFVFVAPAFGGAHIIAGLLGDGFSISHEIFSFSYIWAFMFLTMMMFVSPSDD